ncbi:MAG: DUF3488 and DUF4129 domain-containing transglutaminase family protein [Elainellaceae cyanobacterium]
MAVDSSPQTRDRASNDPSASSRQSLQPRQPKKFEWLWQQFDRDITYVVEDSIALRVFAQAMVFVGIIATDVAAANVTGLSLTSLWAIPTSAIGSGWSYTRRRQGNVATKFCIAIAMLVSLAVFFIQLLLERQDTRLALAQLLIQLQVFHSFDMPRRKDLGYSMMIGMILIGVAGTLSQTLSFGPLLLAFFAIALPALALDYRSRIGLPPRSHLKSSLAALPLKRIGIMMLSALVVGMLIFAALPRFQGYQIRSFPVSTPIEFDGEFEPSAINNPGYINGGEGAEDGFGTESGDGETFNSAPGEVDRQSYYGFSSRMNMNLRGALMPEVVMRVRSQAAGFWRVLAFDRYTGQGWEISRNSDEDVEIVERSRWTYMFRLPWLFGRGRTREVIQTYTITSDLPNLIPALYEPDRLYFPTQQVAIDPEGSLRSPVELVEGVTYTVVSEVPYRDRTKLGEASTDYRTAIRDSYLQVPEDTAPKLRQVAEAALAKADPRPTNPYEISLYLGQYIKQNYTIQPDLPFLDSDQDLAEAFLFGYQGGYPDHFSTVLTLMLRSLGIPSRLVVGFGTGEFNPFTGFYVVQNTDAYAMTEVFFPGNGWVAFDPIPGHELIPPSIEDSETFGVLKRMWNWVAGWLPSPLRGWISGVFDLLSDGATRVVTFVIALFNRGWVGILVGLSLITTGVFVLWLLLNGVRSLVFRMNLKRLPPMESIYQQMLHTLASHGFRKSAAQTPLEYASSLQKTAPERAAAVEEISHAYVQWRYGKREPNIVTLRKRLRSLTPRYFSGGKKSKAYERSS